MFYMLKKIQMFILTLAAIFFLSSCGENSVDDPWAGIGDLIIETEGLKNQTSSFNLNSKLAATGLTKDLKYVLTSDCKRRPKTNFEPSFSKKKYTFKLDPIVNNLSSDLLIINLLADEVLIFPEHFESCSFKINVKNSIGSRDSEELLDVKFNYNDVDTELKLDTSLVNNTIPDIYELNSSLKALYKGDLLQENLTSDDPKILSRLIPEARIKDAKLICYSNQINQSNLNINQDLNNDAIETLNYSLESQLHNITQNYPVENCIYSATDLNNKRVVSKPFNLVRDYSAFKNTIWFDNSDTLKKLTQDAITYISNEKSMEPNLPQTLMSVDYSNTSSDEKMILMNSISELDFESVFFFDLKKIANQRSDSIAFTADQRCPIGATSAIYETNYYGLERVKVPALFSWKSEHLVSKGDLWFLKIPPQSFGTLTLELTLDISLDGIDHSKLKGLIIAPNKHQEFLKIAYASPNEFKLNIIESTTAQDNFYPNESLSNLPTTFRLQEDYDLVQNSAFSILMVNQHQVPDGVLLTESPNSIAIAREQSCFADSNDEPSATNPILQNIER